MRAEKGAAVEVASNAARALASEILENMLDGFVEIAPPDWRITYVNSQAEKLIGAPADTMIGRTIFEISPAVGEHAIYEAVLRVQSSRAPERVVIYAGLIDKWLDVQITTFGDNIGCFCRDVTEQRHAEQALRDSEQRLNDVFGRINDHVASYDREWRYTYVNDKGAEILGKSKEELLGKSIWDLFPDAVGNQYWRELHEAVATQKPIRSEHYYEPFNLWFENYMYPTGDGVTVFSLDITERKQAEKALDVSEERFSRFLKHLPGLAWLKDREGRYVLANEAALGAFGKTSAEVIGRKDEEIFTPETAAQFTANDAEAAKSESGIRTQETLKHLNGTEHVSIVSKFPIFNNEGDVTGIGGIAIDITDRVAAEEAVRSSEARLRELSNSIPAIVWMSPAYGEPTFLNQWYYDYTGLPAGTPGGEGWVSVVHPEDRPEAFAAFKICLSEGKTWEQELRLKRADGEYRWFLTRCVPFRNDAGEVTQWLGTSVDIHERKLVEAELEERVQTRTAELAAANTEMEGFTYSVSHDLRAPVRNIVATSMMLQEDFRASLPPQALEMLESQARSANRLGELIDELLHFSRLGKHEMHREDVSLTELAKLQEAELKRRGAAEIIRFVIQPDLKGVGDPRLISLVLQNLMENACKFSPNGGIVRVGQADGAFYVSDEGIGFDTQYAHKLFLPFERLVRETEFPGTGIGLANVERIIRRHGGRVWAESTPGQGSTFYFTLS